MKLPFILFTYFNPVLQFGLEAFIELVKNKEISGLIIPDLPIEEDAEVRQLAEAAGIHLIPLVAPTSKDRVVRISAKGERLRLLCFLAWRNGRACRIPQRHR